MLCWLSNSISRDFSKGMIMETCKGVHQGKVYPRKTGTSAHQAVR